MIPIHELLNRIRWDPDYGKAVFVIGYYDRLAEAIVRVPFKDIHFDPEDHFDFSFTDEEGQLLTVPLHRIRQVFRNNELVWERRGD
jgi:uncharacterized protein (UPF0248 family)